MVSGEDLWEDLSDSDASEVKVSSKPPNISVKNKQKQHYSAVIQRRINALKVLQLQNKVMETKVIIPVTKDLFNIMYFLQKDDIMLHFTLTGSSDITGFQCLLFCLLGKWFSSVSIALLTLLGFTF